MILQAVLALSLYLPVMTGQLSLATPGFYAIGGYVAAVLSTQKFLAAPGTVYPEPWLSFAAWLGTVFPLVPPGYVFPIHLVFLEMIVAGLLCGVLALVVGLPALRLRGIYFALATIAFVEIVRVVSLNLPITGGSIGIFGIPQPYPTKVEFAWIAVPLLIIVALFVYRLERTRVGRAFAALREDELAASSIGINSTYYRVLAFVISGVIAGMVGAVSAHFINTWNPRQGTFDASILTLAYVIIGGTRTYLGPIAGAFLLTALPEVLRGLADIQSIPSWLGQFLRDGRLILYGLLITLSTIFFPQGLITPTRFRRRKP